MATTAEAYGFGARAPYAQPRASEYDMKERVRLSGLFPRVRNEPLSTQLQALLKDFEQNAALMGILERRRRLDERTQFELKGREGIEAMNRTLAPPFRAGLADAAVSASVADRLVRSQEPGALAPAAAPPTMAGRIRQSAAAKAAAAKAKAAQPAAAKAGAATVVSVVGMSQQGGSSASTDVAPGGVLSDQFVVAPKTSPGAKAPPAKAAPAKAPPAKAPGAKAPGTKAPGAKAPGTRRDNRSPSTSRQRAG